MQLNTVHMVNDNIERRREIEEYVCKKEIYGCKMVDKGENDRRSYFFCSLLF